MSWYDTRATSLIPLLSFLTVRQIYVDADRYAFCGTHSTLFSNNHHPKPTINEMSIQNSRSTQPSLAELCELVSKVASKTAGFEPTELVEFIGIKTRGKANYLWASHVLDQISLLLQPDAYGARSHVKLLQAQHLYEHRLNDAPIEPMTSVLQAITYSKAPNVLRSTGVTVDWKAIVESAYIYTRLSPSEFTLESWASKPRESAVAAAAKSLRQGGYAVEVGQRGLTLPTSDEGRLVARLHGLASQLGGLNLLRNIFSLLQEKYDPNMERYHVIREYRVGIEPAPAMPFGYLLALAAKHLSKPAKTDRPAELWMVLLGLAKDYAALHDVQEYGAQMFNRPSAEDLIQLLARRALADGMFAFPQLRPMDVCRILRGVLHSLPLDTVHGSGWTLRNLFDVIEHIYQSTSDTRGPIVFHIRTLARSFPRISAKLARSILLDVFCHPDAGPNPQFMRPTDRTVRGADPLTGPGNTLYLRPLIRLGNESILLIDKSVAGPAFIEAVLFAMRAIIGNKFQSDVVGPGLEAFIAKELHTHGVPTFAGDYDVGTVHGECDLVVETTDHIAFFELKSKALTRNASAGSDIAVTLSLAGSLISAQQQAIGHDVQLRKNRALTLTSKDTKARYTLEWHGQKVDCIAIGLFDYGGFQDRTAVAHILKHVLGAEYKAVDKAEQALSRGEFDSMNKSIKKLTLHAEDWISLEKQNCDPFFNTWFLSVPQLLVILDGVNSSSEFFQNLYSVRNITYQTYNFYYEYREARKLLRQIG